MRCSLRPISHLYDLDIAPNQLERAPPGGWVHVSLAPEVHRLRGAEHGEADLQPIAGSCETPTHTIKQATQKATRNEHTQRRITQSRGDEVVSKRN